MWWNQRKGSQTSQTSRGSQASRSSHASGRGSQPRELEFQFFIRQTETLYPAWWTREGITDWYRDLPDNTLWNCFICGGVLMALVWEIAQLEGIHIDILDVVYNISYAIHVFAIGYKMVSELESTDITFWTVVSFLVDLGSFAHYAQDHNQKQKFKLVCYYLRLHRPFRYLGSLNDYNLKGSILGTTLKYVYIFLVLRIAWAFVWLHIDSISGLFIERNIEYRESQPTNSRMLTDMQGADESTASQFLSAVYIINKMFIPIGPSVYPDNDVERITCLLIMMTGCLVVTGAAVATLSLIISLYMRPEETFRARYRLIMKEMKDTQVPESLREKVETFYKMYWHKQRAVSETQLMPIFPPTLPATINADIYFEATQKARILRELSYQMLSELSKKMETIHYIPGDAIIKRGARKSNIIYITYGDVEMLTAEDDSTAILRMTRGTVITPCGGAVAAALNPSHLAVRAATFCTAHVLAATDLWRIVYKHSVTQDHAGPILASFTDHIERVKRHYIMKVPDTAIHKSSILNFNRNLMALKEMKDAQGNSLLASSDVFLEIAGCYIMRNRPDSTLTDQSDEICLRPTFPCILQPDSSLLFAWHSFVAGLILIVCVTHPYFLVYKKTVPLEFRFFDNIMTIVFIVDHLVYLSTGANVEEGVPITFAQTSSQQMRSHWFVLDVVATLPIFEFIDDGHFAGINKILRLPKLFRVLKEMEETCVYHSNVLRFLSYSLLLLIACYLIAAMQQGFMCYQSGYCLVTNFTHAPFWDKQPLDEETVSARLWFGLYWAISMINFTVHRQTWGKENWKNVLYTLLILEICIVLRIFMEAVYSATIMVTTALREDYGARIGMVKNFLVRNEVDPQLRKRFIDYLQLCWHTDKAYKISHKNHSTIFYDLPPHVFQDIVGRNRSKYILCIPFMKLLKKDDLRTVSSMSQLFYTSPNEILLNTGELTNEMYIIKQGICEILCPRTQKRVGELTAKCHFGALICLLRLPAYYTIRAVTHVQVFSIPRKYLLNALEIPPIKNALKYLKTQEEFMRMQKPIPSFMKYIPPDPIPNMMRFKLPRKHEPDAAFLQPFKRLGFLSILRYVFPRFTIRPDGTYMLRYEWFRVICALLAAQVFPHYTYLSLQWPFLYYIALFLDMSAWFDIFQRMLVGYFNEKGILIYHPSSTAAYYMKGAFITDLFGCLNLEDLESPHKDSLGHWFRVTPTRQFLMLNRLLQLYRLPSAMMILKKYVERRDVLMVITAIPIFMAMLNVLTCFMIFYSVKIYYYTREDDSFVWFIIPHSDKGGSWLDLFAVRFRFNMTETPWNLHLGTYFWVVYECSTTGYGSLNPSNQDLMQVLFVGMASSTMLITYFSVRIISIRANVNKSLAGFQQHMKDINVYMIKEKLDSELQKEIRRYYEYNWEKMGGIDYRGVLKLCDQITLRTDAILHIYGATFTKCPLLSQADVSLLRIVGRAVHSMYFLREMKIIEFDDMVTDLYFVDYGGVEIRVSIGEMSSILRLPRGSIFGNLKCTVGNRSPYNVVATSRVHLMRIKSMAMASMMADFPSLKELMIKYRGPEKKMYILGSDSKARMRRNVTMGPPPRNKKSIMKYIYFQEGLVQLYLMVVCLTVIYLDLYNVGFQDNRTWLIITLYTLDFCFILKIFTQHALPLLVLNKNMKKIMLPIRKIYFKREFRYDFVSVLPMEMVSFGLKKNKWMWFAWLRLNRVFRVVTVYKCLRRRNEKITVNLTLTTIMAVMTWFTLFVHTTTCIWYFIATIEDNKTANSSWIYTDENTSHCNNHYICSVYFIITTFTQNGVGDIMPRNQSEVVFVSLLQILSTMMFMVYVGEFSNIIQFQSYRSFSFYTKYLELQDFLNNNRVSRNLMTMVNKYTLHLWRETRGLQMPHFLKHAPLSLRLRVMSAAYLHHITRHHIFEECEPAFLRQLVGCVNLYTYNEGMYVVKESEITDSMYVIHTGKVKETCEDMDISARVYPAGSYFGIGLIRNTPYTHSYQTMCKSQVLTIHLDDWEYLLKHFPASRDAIHKHMSQLGDKNMDHSNWPGGAPGPMAAPEYEPLTPIAGLPVDGDISQFPGTQRRFGRRSTDEADIPPSADKKQSRLFAWPTSNRDTDQSPTESARQSMMERGEEQATTVEVQRKMGLFRTIASTAKKLMGRVSDSDLTQGETTEGKDELLLEEDEEATEALLKQFEAAKKKTEKKLKKKEAQSKPQRRKSVFHGMDDESKEKLMLAVDMSQTNLDQVQTESEPFLMKPLQIRDEDKKEKTSTSSRGTWKGLNLGRHRKNKSGKAQNISDTQVRVKKSESEFEETVASLTYGDTTGTQAPESAPSVTKAKATEEATTSQAIERTTDAKDAEETMDARVVDGTTDARAAEETTGATATEQTPWFLQQLLQPFVRVAEESTAAKAAEETRDAKATEETTDDKAAQESTAAKATGKTTDAQTGEKSTDAQAAEETTNVQAADETTIAQAAAETADEKAAEESTATKTVRKTTDAQTADKTTAAEITGKTTDNKAAEESKAAKAAGKGTDAQAAEETMDAKAAAETTYDKATEESKAAKAAGKTTDAQAAKETMDTKAAAETTDDKAAKGSKTAKAAGKTTDAQAAKETMDAKAAAETTDDKATEESKAAKAAEKTTDAQAAEETMDTKAAAETTDDKAAKESKTAKKAGKNTDAQAAKETMDVKAAAATTDDKAAKKSKAAKAAEETTDTHTSQPETPIERKASFGRQLILFDPEQDAAKDTKDVIPESSGKYDEKMEPQDTKKEDKQDTALEDMKEEGTSTSASKLNRRFVRVRYEPEKEDESSETDESLEEEEPRKPPDAHLRIITMDSDEPVSVEKSGEGEEGDDEGTSSTTPDSPDAKKKKPDFRSD